ncbi:MAG TPA: amino acid ABC transporter permease [Candidatus Limnocylindrales bacterium]|nr:amino acid ABC transporter permease [Candidatus Limnocylindrales bacterium]
MSVLYDVPGPRGRLISWIVTIGSILVVAAGLIWGVYRPLAKPVTDSMWDLAPGPEGQFTMARWGILIDPNNESFGLVWQRLGEGWLATFTAAALAIVFSLIIGIGIALLRAQLRGVRGRRYTNRPPVASALLRFATYSGTGASRFWVEFFRGLPVVVTIFLVYRILAQYGLDFEDQMWFLVIGLTLYNSVVIGEILRSGMDGLPHGQHEAASSVGLSIGQSIRLVQLPQALRIMLPALISQIVVIFKDTSLGQIVSFDEALRTSRGIVEFFGAADSPAIPMYFMIGVMYIVICYGLSKLAVYTERRLSRSGMPPAPPAMVTMDQTGAIS